MKVYKVLKPFVDFGIYNGVGSIITNASLINNLYPKLADKTLEAIEVNNKEELNQVKQQPVVDPAAAAEAEKAAKKKLEDEKAKKAAEAVKKAKQEAALKAAKAAKAAAAKKSSNGTTK